MRSLILRAWRTNDNNTELQFSLILKLILNSAAHTDEQIKTNTVIHETEALVMRDENLELW